MCTYCILCQGDERLCTIKSSPFFVVYLFSYSLCIHYHPPSFSVYSHAAITFFLRKMTSYSLSHIHLLFTRRESLSTTPTLSSMYFFFCIVVVLSVCVSLSLSAFLCRFLPVPFVQEKEKYNAWINFLRRVCSSFCDYALFSFFFTYYQFSFSLVRFVTDK
jgi:hypothetical protein